MSSFIPSQYSSSLVIVKVCTERCHDVLLLDSESERSFSAGLPTWQRASVVAWQLKRRRGRASWLQRVRTLRPHGSMCGICSPRRIALRTNKSYPCVARYIESGGRACVVQGQLPSREG
eukprot:2731691-Amphidinium_carterae.2